jgi:hypothetical protein
MKDLGRGEKIDTAMLIGKILLAVAAGVVKQGGNFLPKETVGEISGILDKALEEEGVPDTAETADKRGSRRVCLAHQSVFNHEEHERHGGSFGTDSIINDRSLIHKLSSTPQSATQAPPLLVNATNEYSRRDHHRPTASLGIPQSMSEITSSNCQWDMFSKPRTS